MNHSNSTLSTAVATIATKLAMTLSGLSSNNKSHLLPEGSADHSGDDDQYSGDYSGSGDEDMMPDINENYYYPLIIPACVIVLFNAFIIVLVFSNPKLRRNCNALLVSLALADGCTGLFGIPLLLMAVLHVDSDIKTLCLYTLSMSTWIWFMSVCSIFHLLVIALEQYLAILKPFNHAKIVTRTSVILTLASIWFVSIGHAFIPWSWILPYGDDFCMLEDTTLDKRDRTFTIISSIVFFLVPITIIVYVYFRIVMEAKSHITRIKRDNSVGKSDRRQLHLSPCIRFRGFYIIALMWLVFLVCWAPYFTSVFVVTVGKELPFWLYYKFMVLRFLPSVLNPLIFMFWKSDLRAACIEMFRNCSKKRGSDQQVSFSKQQVTLLNRLSADSTRQSV